MDISKQNTYNVKSSQRKNRPAAACDLVLISVTRALTIAQSYYNFPKSIVNISQAWPGQIDYKLSISEDQGGKKPWIPNIDSIQCVHCNWHHKVTAIVNHVDTLSHLK